MRRRLAVPLIGLPALLLALLLAEGLVRLAGLGPDAPLRRGQAPWDWGDLIHRPSAVPGLAYELVPDLHGDLEGVPILTNALGLRGPPVLAQKGRWLRRLAVVGDSTTFGWGVPGPETWPARLGTELDARAAGWVHEVLNFGVSGYSSRDEAVVLAQRVLPLQPDLILVGYNLNDPEYAPRQPLHSFFAEPAWWEHWRLLRWVDQVWNTVQRRRLGGGDPFRLLHALGTDTWASVEQAFHDMGACAAEAGVPILLVLFPLGRVPADPAAYRYADLHARVAQAAREAGLEVLDLTPAYAAAANGPEYLLPDLHPNALGHALAARAVAERLLVGPPRLPGDR